MDKTDALTDYGAFSRPLVERLLIASGLDVEFERAEGDLLHYRDERGATVEVIDFLGGFGASLLGHNHPELVAVLQGQLASNRPFNGQGSLRGGAGRLARRLCERVERSTGRRYVATLASTGAEAVEAALKHAALERAEAHEALLREMEESFRRLRLGLREGSAFVPDRLLVRAAGLLDAAGIDDVDGLCAKLRARLLDCLDRPLRFLALEGSFHGKTTGALALTHNPEHRRAWQRMAPAEVAFVRPGDEARLAEELARARGRYWALDYAEDGEVLLAEREVSCLAGCAAEPIQGEGGVRELSGSFLQALRRACDGDGMPLIFDEIQCGLGRTGTFLASEASGVSADYYLFSKALGGGLAKVSAMLVDERRYLPRFGLLHTSTFADDDLSSAVGLKVLELIDSNDRALLGQCAAAGQRLLAGLRVLHRRYPSWVREVRGRGLMLGIEILAPADCASPLLRVLSEQNLLLFVLCGYLLRVHGLRVGPTLSAHGTLRLQPSALISQAAIDRLLTALDQTLALLESNDLGRLLGHLLDPAAPPPRTSNGRAGTLRPSPAPRASASRPSTRVGFLVHFLVPEDLAIWEPGLAGYASSAYERFLGGVRGLLRPFVVDRTTIRSARDAVVDLSIIAVPFTPEQALQSLRANSPWALELVRQGLELAREEGCSVLGLGGYTSIVTDNCRKLVEDEIALTSGNSLTAAAALDALWMAARRQQLDPKCCRLGVLGAAGNIGAALAELAAERVREVVLIGRRGSARFLEPLMEVIYASQFRRLQQQRSAGGVAASIAPTRLVQSLLANPPRDPRVAGALIRQGLRDELGEATPIRLTYDIESLRGCELVLTATNSSRPVVFPPHVGEGAVVLGDVAVPQDVDSSVLAARPRAIVLRGGIVKAPLGQALQFAAGHLRPGELFGCLAEAILLGFLQCRQNYSYGRLDAAGIRNIHQQAMLHGFTIEERLASDAG